MTTVIIVIHLMVVLAMIGLVLLQRSEGGALGIGGGGGGAFMTGRGAGNVLTRATAVLAALFFATSIGLAVLAKIESRPSDILERLPGQSAPVTAPAPTAPATGEAPATAEELLRQLGGSAPQTPPASSDESPPASSEPAPAEPTPAAPSSGPQVPPAAPQ